MVLNYALWCDVNRHHHLFMPAFFFLFDFGMWPANVTGNVTWECDLGMRPGNETWECDLAISKAHHSKKCHLNLRPCYLHWEGLGMRLGAHGTWVLAGPSAAVVVGGCCQERGWSRHPGCCQTLSGTPEQHTKFNVRDNMDQTQPDSHHISMRVNTQFPLPSFSRG